MVPHPAVYGQPKLESRGYLFKQEKDTKLGGRIVGLTLGVRGRRSMGVDLDQSTLYEILSELIKLSLKEILDDSLIVDAFLAKSRSSPCSRNPSTSSD